MAGYGVETVLRNSPIRQKNPDLNVLCQCVCVGDLTETHLVEES